MPSCRNPILPGFHPDPSICRVGGDYWLVTSSFEYFPGLPLFHSRDLVNWTPQGHVLTRPSQLDLSRAWESGGLYAPVIRHLDGRFWVACTNISGRGNFLVHAEDPRGPWSEPVWLDVPGIDPDLFLDEGRWWLSTSSTREGRTTLLQAEIDPRTGTILRAPEPLWEGTGGQGTEGPHLYRIGGYVYLLAAEGGTEYGHGEVVARSRSPHGPWEACPRNPILTHRSTNEPVQAVGHADLVSTPDGAWFLVHLGIRPQGYHPAHVLGRETFLTPVVWDADGWPVAGRGGRTPLEWESDLLPEPAAPGGAGRRWIGLPRAFGEAGWVTLRAPVAENYRFEDGAVLLRAGPNGLDHMDGVTWLGRRQTDHHLIANVSLDFQDADRGDEAGLAVWQNYRYHASIGVCGTPEGRRIVVRRHIAGLSTVTASLLVEGLEASGGHGFRDVRLVVAADVQRYRFGVRVPGMPMLLDGPPDPIVWLDAMDARLLSTEVGGRFTGVMLALYCQAGSRPQRPWARFSFLNLSEGSFYNVEADGEPGG